MINNKSILADNDIAVISINRGLKLQNNKALISDMNVKNVSWQQNIQI